ncbi:hypothetical protein K9N68_30070 [Kovacikia minuta CCNUW1]|uniref:hypothetical protein n=1 Tax=Kovacikia minuta TaxID=2931930 RepID=UPI001CCA45DD|nr:hypothetical protein [Kovacikia minuta]UBF25751.1 hypothetical protein K9N68_30070 [Kovacikia minuta CCNUW1]
MVSQRILRITKDTFLKLRPEQSSQLPPSDLYAVKAHTTYEIQAYADRDATGTFNDHIKVTLENPVQGNSVWYVYKLHAQVEYDGDIVYPPEAEISYPILHINAATFFKRRPVQASSLPDAEKYAVNPGQSFPLQSYAYRDASGTFANHIKFALRYQEDFIRGLSTWYAYDRHAYVELNGRVIYPPADPNGYVLRIKTNTLFKRRPLQADELAADEVSPVAAGNIFPLLAYAYGDSSGQSFNGHLKVTFKYVKNYINGANTWYVYGGHAQIEQAGKVVPPPPPVKVSVKGADSISRVTSSSFITQATTLLGSKPAYWGRYFSDLSYTGTGEYLTQEHRLFRANNIRVLPVGRDTTRVSLGQAEGRQDGAQQAADVLGKFGESYLQSQGGEFYLFLDVELTDPLSSSYYIGWSQAVRAASSRVRLLPCVYLNASDATTSRALANAMSAGAVCSGLWIAYYVFYNTSAIVSTPFDGSRASPATSVPAPVLFWQYAGDIAGAYDFNISNPAIDAQTILRRLILPPG